MQSHSLFSNVPGNISMPSGPQLTIQKQTSTAVENIQRSGQQKKVHVVVKNAPFQIVLGLKGDTLHNQTINLHHLTFDAKLLYDTEGNGEKEVDYVRIKPIAFKTKVNEAGDQVNAEVRIKVLTSQHEDMLFVVKLITLDPHMVREFHPGMTILSEPIRVISKTDQVKPNKDFKARNSINEVMNKLAEVHQQQQRNDEIVQQALKEIDKSRKPPGQDAWDLLHTELPTLMPSETPTRSNSHPQLSIPNSASNNFENSLQRFIICYNTLSPDDKPTQIRRLLRHSTTRDTKRLSNFLSLISQESLEGFYSRSLCACKRCPYQSQLESLQKNYDAEEIFNQFN